MNKGKITHKHLLSIVKRFATDYTPFGNDDRETPNWGSDCSAGCQFNIPLEHEYGTDWGVCCNPLARRCGLLTFEHQGCRKFK